MSTRTSISSGRLRRMLLRALRRTARHAAVAVLMAALAWGAAGGARAAEVRVPAPRPGAPTLQRALDAARPGDRLTLPVATYRERIVISRPVTLVGAPGGGTVITGGGSGRVLEITAPDVTVQGLIVRDSGEDISKTDACIYVQEQGARVKLAGNRLEQCAFGIWVNGAPQARVTGNRVVGRAQRILSDRGNGINLWRANGAVVQGNRITETRDGIYLSVSTGTDVSRNLMYRVRFGVHYMYNDRNRVTGNVTCRSHVGLAMMFSKHLEIVDNVALDNTQHGILFRSILDSEIRGNRVRGNGKGLFLNDSSYNDIHGNVVTGNAVGVHLTAGSEDNRIHGNDFVANPVQVKFSWSRAMFWDAPGEGNFWSDYLGWDADRDGRGDRRYYSSNRMDALVYRYPQLKLLAASPLVQAMQALEARFPILRPAGVIDRFPAMRPYGGAAPVAPLPDVQGEPPPCAAPTGAEPRNRS